MSKFARGRRLYESTGGQFLRQVIASERYVAAMSRAEDEAIDKLMREDARRRVFEAEAWRKQVWENLENGRKNTNEVAFTKGTAKDIAYDLIAFCADYDGSTAGFDPDNEADEARLVEAVQDWLDRPKTAG